MVAVNEHLERMRAIVAQAIAEAAHSTGKGPAEVTLFVYGGLGELETRDLFVQASRGTQAQGAGLIVQQADSRYICWNCCGLRFEGGGGLCPNCGELALEVPEEIAFALYKVT